jgi:hypothetical protein
LPGWSTRLAGERPAQIRLQELVGPTPGIAEGPRQFVAFAVVSAEPDRPDRATPSATRLFKMAQRRRWARTPTTLCTSRPVSMEIAPRQVNL